MKLVTNQLCLSPSQFKTVMGITKPLEVLNFKHSDIRKFSTFVKAPPAIQYLAGIQ